MKKLSELYEIDKNQDVLVKGIKINSKEIEPGDIFVCTMGVTADRHDFIPEAIENGAVAVVVEKDIECSVPTIKVENTNRELPILASKFYDHPEEELEFIGITGTNGKTTVATIIQTLMGNDICGYLGTNGISCSKFQESIRNTTPDSDRLYGYFRKFVDNGCRFLSMETSSEAFYRKRLENLNFKIGIITNITEDHLNIHKTIENYVACKKQLVCQVKEDGFSILNSDDSHYEKVRKSAKGTILTYGKQESTLQIIDAHYSFQGTKIKLKYQNQIYEFLSPLLGEFNIYNLCASILALLALGYQIEEIIKKVPNIIAPSGRVEFLEFGQKYHILLDYAHTPDAFSKLFDLLDTIKEGRIITVTGSAGGREKEKRGPMGKLVLEKSDYVIFTMDDPRYENVSDIISDLVKDSNQTNYETIIDRKEAIDKAFEIAQENDIVLIAGKGTDNYMAVEDKYLPYSDLDVIEEYFKENKNG